MLVPGIEIIITDVETGSNMLITKVNEVEVESSWKTLTDTAKITMPRNILMFNKVVNGKQLTLNDIMKRGSTVSIRMGYDGVMKQEFVGYVARVDSKVPATIFCEDKMWQLKQTNFTKAFKSIKLKDLISYIYPGQATVMDFDLPSYRINNTTAAKVLADLKTQYNLYSYFRDGILYVGFPYLFTIIPKKVIHHFQQNVPEDGMNLEYKLPEDYQVRVRGVSTLPGNKTVEYIATDTGGEEYNPAGKKSKFDGDEVLFKCKGLSKSQLKIIVDDMVKKYKIGGYQGNITAFGEPFCRHGDIDHYIDRFYPEREGDYFITKTTAKYGQDGFRRIIEPGRKAT